MRSSAKHTVYTIGHSTHSTEAFSGMLGSFGIKRLVDIRRFPGSRKYPQFNQENLKVALHESGIDYIHMESLGGRRKILDTTKGSRWRNTSFRGYADYMETEEFKTAVGQLESIASRHPTAYMCSEAVWWRCHRSMVSDYLKARGWTVWHIMSAGKSEEHPYTSPAKVVDGHISYSDDDLFS